MHTKKFVLLDPPGILLGQSTQNKKNQPQYPLPLSLLSLINEQPGSIHAKPYPSKTISSTVAYPLPYPPPQLLSFPLLAHAHTIHERVHTRAQTPTHVRTRTRALYPTAAAAFAAVAAAVAAAVDNADVAAIDTRGSSG